MPRRFEIGTATVVMLVVLRLSIGWHFFHEGMDHIVQPSWSSEGFLRMAKGPFAPMVQSYLPDHYDFDRTIHKEVDSNKQEIGPDKEIKDWRETAVENWRAAIADRWDDYLKKFQGFYALDKRQAEAARALVERRVQQIKLWTEETGDALEDHVHEWQRLQQTIANSHEDIPFQAQRIREKQVTLKGEAAGFVKYVRTTEDDLQRDLAGLLTDKQKEKGALAEPTSPLSRVDTFMKYGILAVGVCLLLGLFTRLACLAGAAFLLTIVMTQPFWLTEAAPTANNYLEMLTLLMLATVPVGRWAGLDYFLKCSARGACCSAKGECHAS